MDKEKKELAVQPKKELVLEGDPEQQLEFAGKAAKALMKRVESKKKKVMINGKQYLEFGDWQTLARFFGATVGVDWTKPLLNQKGDSIRGYEARAIVYHHGNIISSAEASCLRAEKRWGMAEEFALKSMAQTRASAKALRNAFGWVAELAGYQSTPAEEMDYDQSPIPDNATVISTGDDVTLDPKKAEEKRKNDEIRNLAESISGVSFSTKQAYWAWLEENTGFKLGPRTLDSILANLKAMSGEE